MTQLVQNPFKNGPKGALGDATVTFEIQFESINETLWKYTVDLPDEGSIVLKS